MEIKAEGKYLRISPRKLRLVAEAVKNSSLALAQAQLQSMNKKGAQLLLKILKSAIANAIHNFNLKEENLKIKSMTVDKAIVFKRYQPVSRGTAHEYKKQTSHASVILEEKKEIKSKEKKEEKNKIKKAGKIRKEKKKGEKSGTKSKS